MPKSLPNEVMGDMFASESSEAADVLREVFELLQDYAPIWYTEELHNRIASSLGEMVLEPVS